MNYNEMKNTGRTAIIHNIESQGASVHSLGGKLLLEAYEMGFDDAYNLVAPNSSLEFIRRAEDVFGQACRPTKSQIMIHNCALSDFYMCGYNSEIFAADKENYGLNTRATMKKFISIFGKVFEESSHTIQKFIDNQTARKS